jgi:hypothetical protein
MGQVVGACLSTLDWQSAFVISCVGLCNVVAHRNTGCKQTSTAHRHQVEPLVHTCEQTCRGQVRCIGLHHSICPNFNLSLMLCAMFLDIAGSALQPPAGE